MSTDHNQLEQIVREGSAFETIQRRLREQGEQLRHAITALNAERSATFGSANMAILGRSRVRSEQNAIARDVVQLGSQLLFGFNLQLGLRKTLNADDVFVLYQLDDQHGEFELTAHSNAGTFLQDSVFLRDFNELQQYYSNAFLSQLVCMGGMLLAVFQIGEKLTDIRVFRWELHPNGSVNRYIDNRGERDLKFPDRFSFKWVTATREMQVQGRQPHLNILDTIFVDNLRGDVTFKIENNTATGQGIFSDPVEVDSQSLDDGSFEYADLGVLILVRILPFTEKTWRYYIFNRDSQTVRRVDELAGSVVALPENHGLIFPAGFYLNSGELKTYEIPAEDFRFLRTIRAPNGEDVLFVFFAQKTGHALLYRYNLINKSTDTPLIGHGYALHSSGRLAIFHAEGEPTLVHPLQLWQTPFMTDTVHAEQQQSNDSVLGKIGNPELVRGIAELNSVVKLIEQPTASERHFNTLIRQIDRSLDQYFWLSDAHFQLFNQQLVATRGTAELMIDEYEKVQAIRQQSNQAIEQAAQQQAQILRELKPKQWTAPDQFVSYLKKIRDHHGQLMTLKDRRYIDLARLEQLQTELHNAQQQLTVQTFDFLASEAALQGYRNTLSELSNHVAQAQTRDDLSKLVIQYRELTLGLDMIQSMLASMSGDNTTQQTQIAENISSIYATINQQRAEAEIRLREQGSAEARAQFAARIRLYEQSLANGLGTLSAPEDCDGLLARMLDQLQELESQFSEFDDFLLLILEQRDSTQDSIEARRLQLQEQRQRRINTLSDANNRILSNIKQRAERFAELAELHAFFAGDAMVAKVRQMAQQLRDIGASLEADSAEGQLRATQDAAMRSVRDRADIFEDGGNLIRLGRHRFSVNQQALDLTLIPRDGQLMLHLTGTQFYEPIEDTRLAALQQYWNIQTPSESEQVYRAEYLAYLVLQKLSSSPQLPFNLADQAALTEYIRQFAAPRYREGYEKGIHDVDAAKIVSTLWTAQQQAGLLRYSPTARAMAMLFWQDLSQKPNCQTASSLQARAQSAGSLQRLLGSEQLLLRLTEEVLPALSVFIERQHLPASATQTQQAAAYLIRQLADTPHGQALRFVSTQYAAQQCQAFGQAAQQHGYQAELQQAIEQALGQSQQQYGKAWAVAETWLTAFLQKNESNNPAQQQHYLPESIAFLLTPDLAHQVQSVELSFVIEGLIGQHTRLQGQQLSIQLDDFFERLQQHEQVVVTGWQQLQHLRHEILQQQRERLRLSEYTAKPLSSFVRNKLISDSYLPLIGDNLAKQMGTVGENRRTDQTGLLMMISPPGYGKTTLMEYVASRLGLIFMKINCPSLGHDVTSLDPAQALHSTAKSELIKLNLALEMGNNVMLYLDDIQHTHPEFLQKFISLCDGTRRIEGVWNGKSKTYDMRGKRFCIAMAGNPYTESGEVFKIPDMLANRADIYNLGDVLSGMEQVFALSYIENAISSNPIIAPMATRGMDDFYRFVDLANGRDVPSTEFDYDYSAAERQDITKVMQSLFKVRQTVLRVNQEYIASSAQADHYRTEPSFRLQGSYRNMNRLAEKVSAIMSEAELERLLDDHYLGEAQLLTQGAEENLLKLKAMRGTLDADEQTRWTQITSEFQRRQQMGGDQDTGEKVVRQLVFISEGLQQLQTTASQQTERQLQQQGENFSQISAGLSGLQHSQRELTAQRNTEQAARDQQQLHLEQLRLQREQDWQQQQQQTLGNLTSQLIAQLQQLDLKPQVHVQIEEPRSVSEVLKQMSSLLAQVLDSLNPQDDQAAQTKAIQDAIQTGQSQTVQLLRQLRMLMVRLDGQVRQSNLQQAQLSSVSPEADAEKQ